MALPSQSEVANEPAASGPRTGAAALHAAAVRAIEGRFAPAAAIILAAAALCLPILVFGFPNGHDARLHMLWHESFARQFWLGDLYPRWLRDVGWGLGGPVFLYYPPVGFYVSALASKLFAADPMGTRALAVAAAAGLAISGLTAYLWLRTMAARIPAMAGAVIYMALPYHLAIDLYLRAAYAEYWAFAWMPAVLFFIARLRGGGCFAVAGLGFSYALLIATHLPTTLLFSPFAACYALHCYGMERRPLSRCILGLALGIALSAVYLLPATTLLDAISAEAFWHDFRYVFSPSTIVAKLTDPAEKVRYGMATYTLVLHLTFVYAALLIRSTWFARSVLDPGDRRRYGFFLWASAACIVLATPVSLPLWEAVPILKKVQFAWRIHAVLCVAVLPLFALAVQALRSPERRERAGAGRLFAVVAAAACVIVAASAAHPQRYDRVDSAIRLAATSGLVEFLPRDARAGLPHANDFDQAISLKYGRNWPRVQLAGASGSVSVERWEAGHIALSVSSPSEAAVVVGQFYFPGWTAWLDGTCCLAVEPDPRTALVRVAVPAGRHRVTLVLSESTAARAGGWISGLAAGATLVLLLAAVCRRARERARHRP